MYDIHCLYWRRRRLKAGTHTGVDAFVSFMPRKVRPMIMFLEKVLVLFLSAVFFKLSLDLVMQLSLIHI